MILKEPPITQPSKVPDSTKSERSKQKPRGGKRKRPKRQINIEQNNKLDRMSFARCKAATRNCRGRKMNYFSVSVRRRNRDQRITEVRTTKLFATLRIRKHRSCRFSRVTERCSPRERPGQEAFGKGAAVTVKSDAKTHRTPKSFAKRGW